MDPNNIPATDLAPDRIYAGLVTPGQWLQLDGQWREVRTASTSRRPDVADITVAGRTTALHYYADESVTVVG